MSAPRTQRKRPPPYLVGAAGWAEGVGFEPTVAINHTRFRDGRIRPGYATPPGVRQPGPRDSESIANRAAVDGRVRTCPPTRGLDGVSPYRQRVSFWTPCEFDDRSGRYVPAD